MLLINFFTTFAAFNISTYHSYFRTYGVCADTRFVYWINLETFVIVVTYVSLGYGEKNVIYLYSIQPNIASKVNHTCQQNQHNLRITVLSADMVQRLMYMLWEHVYHALVFEKCSFFFCSFFLLYCQANNKTLIFELYY